MTDEQRQSARKLAQRLTGAERAEAGEAICEAAITIDDGDAESGESITIRPNRSGKLWSQDPEQWQALCGREGCPWCQGSGPAEEDVITETDTLGSLHPWMRHCQAMSA